MNLSVSNTQTSVSMQFLSASGQSANPVPVQGNREHHHRRVSSDDQLTLSSGAQQPQRVRHEHEDGDHNPMSALDKLVSHLVRTMLKTMVGQGFDLQEPGQTPNQPAAASTPAAASPAGAVPVAADSSVTATPPPVSADTTPVSAATTTAPDTGTSPPAGPFSNAVAAYYQVQSFSFDFSGTVKTEDGQQMGLSVHFSFSQQFYGAIGAAANSNAPAAAGTSDQTSTGNPVATSFEGLAVQLTQSSFSFEVDLNGQPGANPAVPAPATTDATTPPASTDATTVSAPVATSAAPNAVASSSTDSANPMMDQLDKLFEGLQVWLRHPEGGRQLVAVGINRTTAMYVGNLAGAVDAANSQPSVQPAAVAGTAADQTNTQSVNVVA